MNAAPSSRPRWRIVVCSVIEFGLGWMMLMVADAVFSDPSPQKTQWDNVIAVLCLSSALPAVSGGIGLLLTLLPRFHGLRTPTHWLLLTAAAVSLVTSWSCYSLVNEAHRRGGDWHGVAVGAAWFMVLLPLLLAVVSGVAWNLLRRLSARDTGVGAGEK